MPRKFEYRVEILYPFMRALFLGDSDDEETDLPELLATLGNDGWELVNVVKTHTLTTAIFKRELEG